MARLNIQGLSRKDRELMSSLLPAPGNVVVSVDLSAGEPTCTAHYSKDPNYYAATFGMVGKTPYWTTGLLMIDDIYLMTASRSPIGREEILRLWDDGLAEKWVADPEAVKSGEAKKVRALHKPLCLGLSYSMGPKKLVTQAYDSGFELSLATAKEFHRVYWKECFPGVERFGKLLQSKFHKQGYLVTEFGYRLVPDSDHKCLNYFIQSTVSGIMHALNQKFFDRCDFAEFKTVIHDEVIFEVPEEYEQDAKIIWSKCVQELNSDLNWSVEIRTGWKSATNWFDIK